MLKATRLISLILVVLLVFVGCGPSQDAAPKDKAEDIKIKLGVLEPISGAMAPLGTSEYEAIKMAIDMVNEEGGVLGKYKVEHVFADSQSNPSVAASEAERLITTEKVPIIIGTYSSAIAMAVSEISERYKTPLWEMSGAADDLLTRGYKWTFRNEALASNWGVTGAEFVGEHAPEALGKDPKDIKVAIVYEDSPYGVNVSEGNRKYIKKYGMEIVLDEGYSNKTVDLSNIIMKLKAAKPDVLLLTSYVTDAILFNRQAKELGFKVKMFVGHSGGHSVQAFADAVGTDADYLLTVDPAPCKFNTDAISPELAELHNKFVERWTKKFGNPPYHHVESRQFAQTNILLREVLPVAIEKHGGVTPEAIAAAAREIELPEGATLMGYGVKFSTPEEPFKDPWLGNEHVGQNIKSHAFINQYFDGTLYTVWPKKFALKDPVPLLPAEHPLAAQ